MLDVLIPSVILVALIAVLAYHNAHKPKIPDKYYINPAEIDFESQKKQFLDEYNTLVIEHGKLVDRYKLIKNKKSLQAKAFERRLKEKTEQMDKANARLIVNGIIPLT